MISSPLPDIASRVYNHAFKLDPIIRSLLDTDVYKLLMLQTIWKERADVPVTFSLINRTKSVRVADEIDESLLREQLDHARTLTLSKQERIWLAGNTFYGKERLFTADFLLWLKDYQLPEYQLQKEDGQYIINFEGSWADVTMWEIPVLSIISELRSRAAMQHIGRFELDVLYARAKAKLWEKVLRLEKLPELRIADFGTRRRHSFLWQKWCISAMKEGLGDKFIGTSNVLLASNLDLEAIGTNAHELPMIEATRATTDEELLHSPYEVLKMWQRTYDGNLLIVLPDTYGTDTYLKHAPDWVGDWSGFRIDSKEPIAGGRELIAWWKKRGIDPKTKLLIFSDPTIFATARLSKTMRCALFRLYAKLHTPMASLRLNCPTTTTKPPALKAPLNTIEKCLIKNLLTKVKWSFELLAYQRTQVQSDACVAAKPPTLAVIKQANRKPPLESDWQAFVLF